VKHPKVIAENAAYPNAVVDLNADVIAARRLRLAAMVSTFAPFA